MTERTRTFSTRSKGHGTAKETAIAKAGLKSTEIVNQLELLEEIRVIRQKIAERVGMFDVVKDLHRSRKSRR